MEKSAAVTTTVTKITMSKFSNKAYAAAEAAEM
jgi:hypothetical protein